MQSCIYEGQVRHERRTPVAHVFRYRLFMLYLDLEELPRVFAGRWLWSARRPAFAWFRRADHLGDPREPLDRSVRALVERATGRRPQGPIRLLTHLRYGGYGFNPVSFYYCFDAAGREVDCIVAEVNNTPWGERHCYLLDAGGRPLRGYRTPKAMHVSPFMPMDIDYLWSFSPPSERLTVAMSCVRRGEVVFAAGLNLERRELTGAALARALLVHPLMTLQVIAGIYWQALLLWLRGARVHPHPGKARTRST
jgi:DUF1365 family protein